LAATVCSATAAGASVGLGDGEALEEAEGLGLGVALAEGLGDAVGVELAVGDGVGIGVAVGAEPGMLASIVLGATAPVGMRLAKATLTARVGSRSPSRLR